MSRFLTGKWSQIKAYVPGEQPKEPGLLKLNTNESPFGPGPHVLERLGEVVDFQRYPDPGGHRAVRALADYHSLEPNQILLGNGSDELLAFAFVVYGENLVFPQITYGFYPVTAAAFGQKFREIPLDENLAVDPEDYYRAGATVVLANPNAPTGLALSRDQIQRILEKNPHNMVIIDEAYVDFGAQSLVPLIDEYDNLLVIQTFSKSRGLAGLRIGAALAQREIIEDLRKIKDSFNPYSVSKEALVAVEASLEDSDYFKRTIREVVDTRDWFSEKMRALGYQVLDSQANFVFVKGGKAYWNHLRKEGILVRYFEKRPIEEYVRITIGTREEMKRVLKVTEERHA